MKFARVTWVDHLQFVAISDSRHAIVLESATDEVDVPSGTSPMELVLQAVAACTAMDVVHILQRKRLELTGLEVRVEGERAAEHPKVYTKLRIYYAVKGKDLPEKAVRDAIELSQSKYCSVSAMIGKTAEISYEFKIENA